MKSSNFWEALKINLGVCWLCFGAPAHQNTFRIHLKSSHKVTNVNIHYNEDEPSIVVYSSFQLTNFQWMCLKVNTLIHVVKRVKISISLKKTLRNFNIALINKRKFRSSSWDRLLLSSLPAMMMCVGLRVTKFSCTNDFFILSRNKNFCDPYCTLKTGLGLSGVEMSLITSKNLSNKKSKAIHFASQRQIQVNSISLF